MEALQRTRSCDQRRSGCHAGFDGSLAASQDVGLVPIHVENGFAFGEVQAQRARDIDEYVDTPDVTALEEVGGEDGVESRRSDPESLRVQE